VGFETKWQRSAQIDRQMKSSVSIFHVQVRIELVRNHFLDFDPGTNASETMISDRGQIDGLFGLVVSSMRVVFSFSNLGRFVLLCLFREAARSFS
jgi:hypothetical protein